MKCEGCGASLGERVTQCEYCGRRLGTLDNFDVEAATLLRTLEDRLEKEVTRRSDPSLYPAFFVWIISGPVAFIVLGEVTDIGYIGRGAASLLLMASSFMLLAWFIVDRQDHAEDAIWNESVAAEVRGFMMRKGLSSSELLVLVKRLLGDDSRLVKRISRGDLGAQES